MIKDINSNKSTFIGVPMIKRAVNIKLIKEGALSCSNSILYVFSNTICIFSFPLEMHLVFFNLKYSNFSNAMEQADGLTVMGVLFKVLHYLLNTIYSSFYIFFLIQYQATQKDNPNFDFTQTFSQITTYQASTKYDFRGQSYSSLLPISRTNYYTYHGSLTTPPCSESVTWIVFMNQVPISSRQVTIEHGYNKNYYAK